MSTRTDYQRGKHYIFIEGGEVAEEVQKHIQLGVIEPKGYKEAVLCFKTDPNARVQYPLKLISPTEEVWVSLFNGHYSDLVAAANILFAMGFAPHWEDVYSFFGDYKKKTTFRKEWSRFR